MNTENNEPRKYQRYDEAFKRSAGLIMLRRVRAEDAADAAWDFLLRLKRSPQGLEG